jgi:hypothetical protein
MDLQRDIISPSPQKFKTQSTGTPSFFYSNKRIFAFNDLATILKNLEREASSHSPASEWAHSTLTTLRQRSPTSLHVSLLAMRTTIEKTRYATFQREYELASHFVVQPDFVNGVIARLIKRSEPTWTLPETTLENPQQWVDEHIIKRGRFLEPLHQSFYMLEEGKRDLVTKERGLFKYSLPMEISVLATLMGGKMDGSPGDDVRFTRKEFVEYVVGENLGRAGAERKLNSILDRKTVEDMDGKLIWKFDNAQKKN